MELKMKQSFGAKFYFGYYAPWLNYTNRCAQLFGQGQDNTPVLDIHEVHFTSDHHSDTISQCISPGKDTYHYNVYSWYLTQPSGVLPTLNDIDVHQKYTNSFITLGPLTNNYIGLFGDGTVSSQAQTRIYFYDVSEYSKSTDGNAVPFQSPRVTYVPVIHNDTPCFYDYVTTSYIYNSGPGTPKIMELG